MTSMQQVGRTGDNLMALRENVTSDVQAHEKAHTGFHEESAHPLHEKHI